MSQPMMITQEDILHQVKLSCKIPEIVEQIVTRKVIVSSIADAGIKIETEINEKDINEFIDTHKSPKIANRPEVLENDENLEF